MSAVTLDQAVDRLRAGITLGECIDADTSFQAFDVAGDSIGFITIREVAAALGVAD